jgi:hypothetical protein
MKESVDIFISRLYTSNDPMCLEAAVKIEKQLDHIRNLESVNNKVILASKYMAESLFEIVELSKSRDKYQRSPKPPELVRELNLRLKECANIATDTLKLETVVKAFEKMKD